MQKRSLAPAAVLAAGIIGAVLRRMELDTAFEENGLPIPWARATVALALVSALVFVLCAALAVSLKKRFVPQEGFKRAYRTDSYLLFAIMALLGGGVLVCAALLLISGGDVLGLTGWMRYVFLLLMALSGIGMALMAYSVYTRKDTRLLKIGSVMPSLFYCFWMVSLYRQNAGNPVILDYCYSALALGAAAVSSYYAAGYAFGRQSLSGCVLISLTAVYLLTVAAADPAPMTLRLVLAAGAVFITVNTTSLLSRSTPVPENQ